MSTSTILRFSRCSCLPFTLQLLNLGDSHSKNEDILITHFLPHLHIGTIQSANCQSTIGLGVEYSPLDHITLRQPPYS